jgi:hypothetical protein
MGPITPTLMVPVPLAALLPPELELELELPPQAASANNAVTAAAAVRYLARERADKGRADTRRPDRGRPAAAHALGCARAELSAGAELAAEADADVGLDAGARWSAAGGLSNCLGLIADPPFVEAAGGGRGPFRPVTLSRIGVTLGCGHNRMMRCRLAPSNSSWSAALRPSERMVSSTSTGPVLAVIAAHREVGAVHHPLGTENSRPQRIAAAEPLTIESLKNLRN